MAAAASHFGVSEQTLYNWRSTVGVPPSRVEWVRTRMAEFEKLESATLPDRLTLEATPDQFDDWNRAALAQGKILRQWAADTLDAAATDPPVKKPIRYSDRPGLPSATLNEP